MEYELTVLVHPDRESELEKALDKKHQQTDETD